MFDAFQHAGASKGELFEGLRDEALRTEAAGELMPQRGDHPTPPVNEVAKLIADAVNEGDLKLALKTLRIHIGQAPKTYAQNIADIAEFDRVRTAV